MSVFTVRIERGSEAHVVGCAQYRKVVRPADGCAVLTLYAAEGSIDHQIPTLVLPIDEDKRVFVMNAQGNTVDTLRASQQRSHLRTTQASR